MVQRVAPLPITLAVALAAMAGCTTSEDPAASDPVVVYEHHWTYGPGYYRVDDQGDPIFLDQFTAEVGGAWTLNVTSETEVGTYELHLREPHGTVRAVATHPGDYAVDGVEGRWSLEILTEAPQDETPTGNVNLTMSTDE